jgi:HK97 family phage prohead protease
MSMETRYVQFEALEVRDGEAGQGNTLVGYAAVFNAEVDLGKFRELIVPGAFGRSLQSGRQVRALFEHDPAKLLGTSGNGTLRLAEDAKGLRVEIDVNADTSHGRDAIALVRRGDIRGMSFGFLVPRNGQAFSRTPAGTLRTLSEIDLREVTVTSVPAYAETSLSLRVDPEAIAAAAALTDQTRLHTAQQKLRQAQAAM